MRHPGIGRRAATVILAEIGRAMSRFPAAGHPLACAGPCPSQNESAGGRRATAVKAKRLVAPLNHLGYKVDIQPLEPGA